MAFVIILVKTDSSKPCASCAAGVICLFVHYLRKKASDNFLSPRAGPLDSFLGPRDH